MDYLLDSLTNYQTLIVKQRPKTSLWDLFCTTNKDYEYKIYDQNKNYSCHQEIEVFAGDSTQQPGKYMGRIKERFSGCGAPVLNTFDEDDLEVYRTVGNEVCCCPTIYSLGIHQGNRITSGGWGEVGTEVGEIRRGYRSIGLKNDLFSGTDDANNFYINFPPSATGSQRALLLVDKDKNKNINIDNNNEEIINNNTTISDNDIVLSTTTSPSEIDHNNNNHNETTTASITVDEGTENMNTDIIVPLTDNKQITTTTTTTTTATTTAAHNQPQTQNIIQDKLKTIIIESWRQRLSPFQWSTKLSEYFNTIDSDNAENNNNDQSNRGEYLCEILLKQMYIGKIPSPLLVSYLRYAISFKHVDFIQFFISVAKYSSTSFTPQKSQHFSVILDILLDLIKIIDNKPKSITIINKTIINDITNDNNSNNSNQQQQHNNNNNNAHKNQQQNGQLHKKPNGIHHPHNNNDKKLENGNGHSHMNGIHLNGIPEINHKRKRKHPNNIIEQKKKHNHSTTTITTSEHNEPQQQTELNENESYHRCILSYTNLAILLFKSIELGLSSSSSSSSTQQPTSPPSNTNNNIEQQPIIYENAIKALKIIQVLIENHRTRSFIYLSKFELQSEFKQMYNLFQDIQKIMRQIKQQQSTTTTNSTTITTTTTTTTTTENNNIVLNFITQNCFKLFTDLRRILQQSTYVPTDEIMGLIHSQTQSDKQLILGIELILEEQITGSAFSEDFNHECFQKLMMIKSIKSLSNLDFIMEVLKILFNRLSNSDPTSNEFKKIKSFILFRIPLFYSEYLLQDENNRKLLNNNNCSNQQQQQQQQPTLASPSKYIENALYQISLFSSLCQFEDNIFLSLIQILIKKKLVNVAYLKYLFPSYLSDIEIIENEISQTFPSEISFDTILNGTQIHSLEDVYKVQELLQSFVPLDTENFQLSILNIQNLMNLIKTHLINPFDYQDKLVSIIFEKSEYSFIDWMYDNFNDTEINFSSCQSQQVSTEDYNFLNALLNDRDQLENTILREFSAWGIVHKLPNILFLLISCLEKNLTTEEIIINVTGTLISSIPYSPIIISKNLASFLGNHLHLLECDITFRINDPNGIQQQFQIYNPNPDTLRKIFPNDPNNQFNKEKEMGGPTTNTVTNGEKSSAYLFLLPPALAIKELIESILLNLSPSIKDIPKDLLKHILFKTDVFQFVNLVCKEIFDIVLITNTTDSLYSVRAVELGGYLLGSVVGIEAIPILFNSTIPSWAEHIQTAFQESDNQNSCLHLNGAKPKIQSSEEGVEQKIVCSNGGSCYNPGITEEQQKNDTDFEWDMVCAQPNGIDGPCNTTFSPECDVSLSCSGRCAPLKYLQFDEECDTPEFCQSGKCVRFKCNQNLCYSDLECMSKNFCQGGECVPKLKQGRNCTRDTQCDLFSVCQSEICIQKYSLPEGGECNSTLSCDISQSLYCDKHTKTCKKYKPSETKNCQKDGCQDELEFCECDLNQCKPYDIVTKECKEAHKEIDACVYNRCVYTEGYLYKDSCVMKNCGKQVCNYFTKCKDRPCGNPKSYCSASNQSTINTNIFRGVEYKMTTSLTLKEKSNGIYNWLKDNGFIIDESLIQIVYNKDESSNDEDIISGMGIVALQDLKVDTIVGSIPKKSILSIHTSSISDLLKKYKIKGPIAVSIALLYEASIGESSKWYGYIKSLPMVVDLPILWDKESKSLLLGTSLNSMVDEDLELLESSYHKYVEGCLKKNHPDKFGNTFFNLEAFKIANTIVSSRAFCVDEYHGDSMVPLADIFNHRTGRENIHIESDGDVCKICGSLKSYEEDLVVTVVKNVLKGEEVFNTYGFHDNAILLNKYGFLEMDNPAKKVDLPKQLVDSYLEKNLEKVLVKSRLGFFGKIFDADSRDQHNIDIKGKVDDALITSLWICLIPFKTFQSISTMNKSKLYQYLEKLDAEDLIRQEYSVKEAIIQILVNRLNQYPNKSTLEQDKQSLQDIDQQLLTKNNEKQLQRKKLSLSLRICEKELLEKSITYYRSI
eukprot:gene3279-4107_t